jgi:hypothetical protein
MTLDDDWELELKVRVFVGAPGGISEVGPAQAKVANEGRYGLAPARIRFSTLLAIAFSHPQMTAFGNSSLSPRAG